MALWDLLKNKQATSGNDNGDSAGGGLSSLLSLFGGNKEDDEYGRNLPPLQREDNSTPSNRIYLNDRIGFKSNTNINSPNLDTITGGAANQGSATVTGLQLSPDGSVMYEINTPNENKSADMGDGYFKRAKSGIKNFNLSNALFGNQAQATDNVGTQQGEEVVLKDAITGEPVAYKTTNNMTVSSNPRVGGLLNDLIAGADENYNNRFSINNWQNNDLDYGRKKGAAYRIGEGLGSLGRALATWGGDAWIAGSQGLDAAMKRQGYRTGDQLYRQQLKDNYGYTDEQLNNLKGYITKDDFTTLANNIYKNQALQVRQAIAGAQDNTKRANMIMQGLNNGTITPDEAKMHMANYGITFEDLQRSNASRNADMNAELLPYKKYALQMAPQIAAGNLGLAQARFAYQQQQDAFDNALKLQKLQGGAGLSKADQKAYNENLSTLSDIDAGLKLISENPDAYSPVKGITPSWLLNYTDPKGIPTRTQIDNITAVYRKWLTGAQMSDAERKAYERFLPAPTDNAVAVKAKLQGMRDSIERKNNILMQNAQSYQQQNNNGGWAF